MTIEISDYFTDDPDLPLADPRLALNNENCLAIWDMQSTLDASGNGNNLTWDGTFDPSTGAVLTAGEGGVITTPIFEQDEMTILLAYNLVQPASGVNAVLFSNFVPAVAPFAGTRLSYNGSSASGTFAVATGLASPSAATLTNATIVNAWTLQAYTISAANSRMQRVNRTGGVNTATISSRAKGGRLYLNGMPASVPAAIKTGFAGALGFAAVYDRELTTVEITAYLDVMASLMASRGVSIS